METRRDAVKQSAETNNEHARKEKGRDRIGTRHFPNTDLQPGAFDAVPHTANATGNPQAQLIDLEFALRYQFKARTLDWMHAARVHFDRGAFAAHRVETLHRLII